MDNTGVTTGKAKKAILKGPQWMDGALKSSQWVHLQKAHYLKHYDINPFYIMNIRDYSLKHIVLKHFQTVD